MKNIFQTIVLFVMFTSNINAQSTERFIRIIGNAKKEIKAEKAKIYFTVKEFPANNYQNTNTTSRTYEEVYEIVLTTLDEIGIKKNDINKSLKKLNRYDKSKFQNFFIETNFDVLDKLNSLHIDGFQITDIKYIMPEMDEEIETKLSLEAIEDAKRKSKAICDRIGMKQGSILNIEVKPNDFERNTNEFKEMFKFENYKVSITFKLID